MEPYQDPNEPWTYLTRAMGRDPETLAAEEAASSGSLPYRIGRAGYRVGQWMEDDPQAALDREQKKRDDEINAEREAEWAVRGHPVVRFGRSLSAGLTGREEPVVPEMPPKPVKAALVPDSPLQSSVPPPWSPNILPTMPSDGSTPAAYPSGAPLREGGSLDIRPAREKTLSEKGYRAIRMPNGHMLFTNVGTAEGGMGGEEFSPEEGAQIVREQDRALDRAVPMPPSFRDDRVPPAPSTLDPAGLAMRALIRSSMRSTADSTYGTAGQAAQARRAAITPPSPGPEPEPVHRGVMVKGEMPMPGITMAGGYRAPTGNEGTPEMRRAMELEDAIGIGNIAKVRQATALANLSPEAAAFLENRDLQTMTAMARTIQPRIEAAVQTSERLLADAEKIPDPAQRERAKAEITEWRKRNIDPWLSLNLAVKPGAGVPSSMFQPTF